MSNRSRFHRTSGLLSAEATWRSPRHGLDLPQDELHLWRASLEQTVDRLEQMSSWLSPDEQHRAGRIRRESDAWRYVAGRGALRSILARYLDLDPGRVAFRYGPQGKPALAEGLNSAGVAFSLAHSGTLALVAVVCRRAVGVDLEQVRLLVDEDAMAARFFAAAEYTAYRGLTRDQRTPAFYRCWTRKEAYLKALGDGLTRPLPDFEVTLDPNETARLLHVGWDPDAAAHWTLISLEPAAGFVAAAALPGPTPEVACWEYT